jgi:hypothetical protein
MDTKLVVDDGSSFASPAYENDIDIISYPIHGMLKQKKCPILFHPSWACFDYLPDSGFTGWDLFTIQPWAEGFDLYDVPGKVVEVAIYVGEPPYPTPEFPSILLPVTMIIAFLGAVLYIRRTREI